MTENRPVLIEDNNQEQQTDYVTYERIERTPAEARRERSGCFWGLLGMGGCLAIPLFAIAVAIILGTTTISGVFDGVLNIFRSEPRTATITTSRTVINSVQPLGQLVSISAQLAKADIRVTVRDGFQNACGRSANHVAQGTIEAGVDLTQLSEDDVTYNPLTETYTIQLPAPQLTSCRIDLIRQYSRSTSACGTSWDNLRLLANYRALLDFRDESLEGGILDRAEEEALITLSNFLQLSTGSAVEIEFVQPEERVLPSSCQPDEPLGWDYNPQADAWSTG